ncbi:MAG: MarR family winged helix-turn-helix transcriptional regulator [Candidatus Levyibacteriota bacterium]
MNDTYIKDELAWKLLQVAIAAKHDLMRVAEKYKLSVMQLYTLCLLDSTNSIPMNSLSSMLHCDASNVTGIVDRLLLNKYIVRAENPEDRREKMIKLTIKGTQLCIKISAEISNFQPVNLDRLSEKQNKQLSDLLTILLSDQSVTKK